MENNNLTTDLLVIGGGITGLGIARDAALRGLNVTLIERGSLGSGTSGYFHNILHSGARYAVVDPESAKECYEENLILKKIAKDAIYNTGSVFLAYDASEVAFADTLLAACKNVGIPTEEISVQEVLKQEPRISKKLKRVFTVPAAHIDGEKTIEMNTNAALNLGVTILTNCEVTSLFTSHGRIEGVRVKTKTNAEKTLKARYVINAAGIWAKTVASLAGITIPLTGYKGSLVVYSELFSKQYLQRCRMPSDGDLLLPTRSEYIIGTTSIKTDDIDTHEVEQWEIDKIVKEAGVMVPEIARAHIKRVYAGVRPIYTPPSDKILERQESRSFHILNHKTEGLENFLSVVGGKFMIYRLMAEKAVDEVCKELRYHKRSATKELPL